MLDDQTSDTSDMVEAADGGWHNADAVDT